MAAATISKHRLDTSLLVRVACMCRPKERAIPPEKRQVQERGALSTRDLRQDLATYPYR